MRVDVDIALLQDCADRHFDFMREYRLTGDIKYLKGFVMDIIEEVTQEKADSAIIKEFDLALTDRERHVLSAIYRQIGQNGNISVVKMVQQAGVSRPVIDNLLNRQYNKNRIFTLLDPCTRQRKTKPKFYNFTMDFS